ncbi:phosphatidylserine decarboxylase [Mycena albidolilacea]|uniref:Phosphatidylserine decarboxylase n=1 Tax=Mycena albidolilacea TaxID=1033008 RepID=A0AAD7AKG3_9AGAR|nr:phosphatidylserine decarboxylase [Mycena albidolilacea]
METNTRLTEHFRRTGWLATSEAALLQWIKDVVSEVLTGRRRNETLLPVIREFQTLIETNSELYMGFNQMFEQQPPSSLLAAIPNYQTMLKVFNKLIQEAPFYGPIGPPFYMILNAAMNTPGGWSAFLNDQLNAQFKRMFDVWAKFLVSPNSCYVLTSAPGGWFSSPALTALTENFDGLRFEQIFESDPNAEYWGYKSWDDFFVRTFQPGVRTLQAADNPNIINAACESQLYHIARNVQERDTFWLKGEPYSLLNMLNQDEAAPQFIGGTVFQGFLSVTGYHRWHAPVTGVVRKIVHVPGTYFVQSPATLGQSDNPYLRSLAFITSLTTRLLIFIEADDPRVGLMCFIAVGMTEVSTCEATVAEGKRVQRGDELGMFHFGGSTHVLVFRPQTNLQFFDNVDTPGDMVEVRGALAGVLDVPLVHVQQTLQSLSGSL